MRTLIVDKDPASRESVRPLLAQEKGLEVLADSAVEPAAAMEAIRREKPDLLAVDAQTFGTAGFEMLAAMDPEEAPALIVLAADTQHAVAAFEFHALDYLLKPVEPRRLQHALQRAREYLEARGGARVSQHQMRLLEDLHSAPHYLTRVKVKAADRILFLRVEEIDWVSAADNYVVLHVGKQTYMLREKLSELENSLDPEMFFRISRSALVNVSRIAELRTVFKDYHMVVLDDGARLPMTRGVQELEELLQFS